LITGLAQLLLLLLTRLLLRILAQMRLILPHPTRVFIREILQILFKPFELKLVFVVIILMPELLLGVTGIQLPNSFRFLFLVLAVGVGQTWVRRRLGVGLDLELGLGFRVLLDLVRIIQL